MITRKISSYRKYTPYVILVFFFMSLFFILKTTQFKELKTTFTLKTKEQYKNNPTVEIANFNEGESWKGNFTLDSVRTFDGETGMNIFSVNGKLNSVTLTKQMDLSVPDTIYAYVYVDNDSITNNIESLIVVFESIKNQNAQYAILSMKTGWNLVTMPKSNFKNNDLNWKQVESVSIKLISKKGVNAQIAFDRIWAQKPLQNIPGFISAPSEYLNLKTIGKNTYLHLGSPIPTKVILNKSVKNDFMYTVAFAPLKLGTFGLSFQTDSLSDEGYFLLIDGKRMDSWRLYKKQGGKETNLSQGSLSSNIFEKEAYVWLRTEKKGSKISTSFSINNQMYVPIKELEDSTFSKGRLGLFSQGSYLIDTIEVKE